jgi:hypothetical protein
MIAPLYDSRGTIRYFIGAQVDVSGLAKDCSGLESLRRLVEEDEVNDVGIKQKEDDGATGGQAGESTKPNNFGELAEMFNLHELETVRKHGGNMHRLQHEEVQHADAASNWHKPRILIQDSASSIVKGPNSPATGGTIDPSSGRLTGIYEHYLLVRPYPSLRILFASPSLRVPGILQSNFMSRIGGSDRIRDELTQALADGHGVTAKIRWVVSKGTGEGRPRWIHCTPLLGSNGAIGVWMIVIVDDDEGVGPRKGKDAPPVPEARTLGRSAGKAHVRKPAIDDTMSLREFAAQSRLADGAEKGRSRSALAMAKGGDENPAADDTRPSSPYTLRIGDD